MTTTRRSVLGLIGVSGAALATGGAAFASPSGLPDDLRPGGALDRYVKEQADKDVFSGSLLLTYRGRPVLARSYGKANDTAPNGPDTLFAMASVTKLFTAVSIAQLVQAGKVAYNGKLGAYLNGFPAAMADTVTIHHLLTHSSGLGDPFSWPDYMDTALTWTSPQQVMDNTTDFIRRSTLAFTPGAGFQYSNAGYHVLGAIVAAVSGQTYYDYVREHVFRPAGMTSTDFYARPQWHTDPRIAHPYATSPTGGGRTDSIDQRLYIGTPAGDAFSTCADMTRFACALQGEKLLNRAFTHITLTGKEPLGPPTAPPNQPPPPKPPLAFQGYGPMTTLVNNQWVTGHSGGAPGTSTDFQMYPDSEWVTVFLSNIDLGHGVIPAIPGKIRNLITGNA